MLRNYIRIVKCLNCLRRSLQIGKWFEFPRRGWMGGVCNHCVWDAIKKLECVPRQRQEVSGLLVDATLEKEVSKIEKYAP